MIYLLNFKWTISRGRDTEGYNICSLWVNGKKVSSCNGGGYDLTGTSLAMWIEEAFQDRLRGIHQEAYEALVIRAGPYERLGERKDHNLYGMTAYYMTAYDKEGRGLHRVGLDGGCGFSCIEKVMDRIGLNLKRLPGSSKNKEIYILTDKRAREEDE